MENAKNFVLWFIQNLPSFFLSEPIIYFVGMGFLAFTIKLFYRIKSI